MAVNSCTWSQDSDPDSDTWVSDCGAMFIFNDGSPKDNDFKFCYRCGKPLEEDKRSWDEGDAALSQQEGKS